MKTISSITLALFAVAQLGAQDVVRIEIQVNQVKPEPVVAPAPAVNLVVKPAVPILVVPIGVPAEGAKPLTVLLPKPPVAAPIAVPIPTGPRLETLTLLSGDNFRGNFLSFDANSGLRWQHPAIKQPFEVDAGSLSLIRVERPKAKGAGQRHTFAVKFVNDDELLGEVLEMDAEKLLFKTWYAGTLTIPRKAVRSITPGQSSPTAIYEGPTGMEGWSGGNRNSVGRAVPMGVNFGAVGINIGGLVPGVAIVPGVARDAVQLFEGNVIVNGVQIGGAPVARPSLAAAATASGWQFSNDAFVNTTTGATIGRKVEFPKLANIEFDLAWRGYVNLAVHLYSDKLEQYQGNAYVVNINQSVVYLYRHTPETGQSRLGNGPSRLAAPKTSAQVSIRVNKEQKTFAVLIDGVLVGQWNDRDAFAGKGNGLMFVSQGSGATKISGIRVCEWDGRLPLGNAGTAPTKLTEDYARLANNDNLSGAFKGIKDGKASFTTSFAPNLEIPLDRVGQIELVAPEKPAPVAGFVRATFKGRGLLTFKLESWTDAEVKVSSPNFGGATFTPDIFSQLEFNLDKPRTGNNDPLGF